MVKTVILWLAALGIACAEPVTLRWDIPTSGWAGKNVDVLVEVSTNQQVWTYVGCQPDQTVNTVQVNAPDARPKWFRVRAIQADVLDCDAASALASSVYSNVVAQALAQYSAVAVNPKLPWTTENKMTVLTLNSPWSADIDAANKYPNDGSDWCGQNGAYRVAMRFDITSLPTAATVTQIRLLIFTSKGGGASDQWSINPYNATGQGNPQTDAVSIAFPAIVAGTSYNTGLTEFRTTGLKTITLGSASHAHLQNARAAGTIYSLGIWQSVTSGSYAEFREYSHSTDPPKLEITYTLPGAALPPHNRRRMYANLLGF